MKTHRYIFSLESLLLLLVAACNTGPQPAGVSAPSVELLAPTAGQVVSAQPVAVSGRVVAEGGLAALEYRLGNGEAVSLPVEEGQREQDFSMAVPVPVGESLLVVTAKDTSGQEGRAEVRFTRADAQAPQLSLTSPLAGARTSAYHVLVKGTVVDESGLASLTWQLNGGEEVALDEAARLAKGLEFGLRPAPGPNTLVVRARDEWGNAGELSVSFHFGSRTAGGGLHSGALREGQLYTWGRNNRGQLGLGTTADTKAPQRVESLADMAAIAFSQNSSLALRVDGSVWTWGENASGQLGLGSPGTPDTTPRSAPTRIASISDAVAGALGYTHGLVLHRGGHVSAFGKNNNGQLGDGTLTDRHYPVPVAGLSDVIQVVGGSQHSVALRRDGTVWVWGRNSYGNLGQGTVDEDTHPTPTQVPGLTDVVDIATGRDHVLALSADGTVYAWGLNTNGQLGDGQGGTGSQRATPGKVQGLTGAKAVFAQANMSFALLADGTLWGWGQNFNGQLGTGDTTELQVPTTPVVQRVEPLQALTGLSDVGPGATHVIARHESGSVFVWGWSARGSLGREDLLENWPYPVPIQVVLP